MIFILHNTLFKLNSPDFLHVFKFPMRKQVQEFCVERTNPESAMINPNIRRI